MGGAGGGPGPPGQRRPGGGRRVRPHVGRNQGHVNPCASHRHQTNFCCSKSVCSCVKRPKTLVKCDFVNVVVAKQSETVLLFEFCNKFETICVKPFYQTSSCRGTASTY